MQLEFTPEAIEAVADKALERGTGARGLRAILEESLLDVMFEVPSAADVAAVLVTAESINGQEQPTMLPRAKLAQRRGDLSA